jgi:hypothetical protein
MKHAVRFAGSIVASLAFTAVAMAQAAEPLFPARQFPAPDVGSFSLAIADVNGDGTSDYVAAAAIGSSGGVAVGLGDGQGAFPTVNYIWLGNFQTPQQVSVGDVNGDLHPDVAVASWGQPLTGFYGTVKVFLGDGTGAFPTEINLPVGPMAVPYAVVLGDWSGDGQLDLVASVLAPGSNSKLYVFQGNGAGGFTLASTANVSGYILELALARIDGDAQLDLVSDDNGASLRVFRGLGAAGFATPVTYSVGVDVLHMSIADANGDGWNDVVSGEIGVNGRACVTWNDGAGGFLPATTYAAGAETTWAICEDLDGDGVRDLVAASRGNNGTLGGHVAGSVSLFHGLGGGAYAAPVAWLAGYSPSTVAAADIDGDGDRDLLVADYSGSYVHALVALSPGNYLTYSRIATPFYAYSVALGDLDGDGNGDLVVGGDAKIEIHFGDGAGGFGPASTKTVGGTVVSIALGDLNGDQRPDVALGTTVDAIVILNNGIGGLHAPVIWSAGPSPWGVAFADLDRDGDLDLAIGNSGASSVSVRLGVGNGTFGAATSFTVGSAPRSIAATDVDRDGWIDLVSGSFGSGTVSILRGIGAGTFAPATSVVVGAHVLTIAAGDVNRDGIPDLAVGADDTRILLGNGAGGFALAQVLGQAPAEGIAIGDVDGDGLADVSFVTPTTGVNGVWVMQGDGTGGFPSHLAFATERAPRALAVGDVDGDDRPDVAVANSVSWSATVLRAHRPYSSLIYCSAKKNSLGCTPEIHFSGSPSATAASGFDVRCTGVLNNKSGLLIYGVNGRASLPFQGGLLCVASPVKRTPATTSGGHPPPNDCSGLFAIDMNTYAQGALGGAPLAALKTPGTTVRCEWWGRDPGFAPPNGTTLSDALEYVVGP